MQYLKYDKRAGKYFRLSSPPRFLSKDTSEKDFGNESVPRVRAVLQHPMLTAQGELIAQPGYHQGQQWLFDQANLRCFPTITESPSKLDALEAYHRISALFDEFPFLTQADRMAALMAVITALLRPAMKQAYCFVFTSPVRGSGKTLLATIPALIATGADPSTIPAKEEVELGKRIDAAMIEGDRHILVDNHPKGVPFGLDSLDAILTSPTVKIRVLGESKHVVCDTARWVAITGNNFVGKGDFTRRALACRIDPKLEQPELRTFKDPELKATVLTHRIELMLIRNYLVIVKAYFAADCPMEGKGLQDAGWSGCLRMARDPLLWLTGVDALETKQHLETDDPIREIEAELLTLWESCFPDRGEHSASALAAEASKHRELTGCLPRDKSGNISIVSLGKRLRNVDGRVINGIGCGKEVLCVLVRSVSTSSMLVSMEVHRVHRVFAATQAGMSFAHKWIEKQ